MPICQMYFFKNITKLKKHFGVNIVASLYGCYFNGCANVRVNGRMAMGSVSVRTICQTDLDAILVLLDA